MTQGLGFSMNQKIGAEMVKDKSKGAKVGLATGSLLGEAPKMLRKQYSHNWWAWRGTGRRPELDHK
ncbi:hypothetical protein M758_6G181200 [Ceratodon purpureus]|nr:hypothetical protein M758_6G181200 [Ceratodon purpureus]